ncbi:hypothetical protein BJY24_001748 [Nocardia transvalensis]|uniref:Uncharacterized protein n=1 Tax=Nocardia transvalensis TaxID=37333 RepID=A0A7W9PB60_9NOCA|nr:hypothetical protein [Nocardia transvalensis]MBB5912881.1 hypothetical protein [Nocardia transvalensis]
MSREIVEYDDRWVVKPLRGQVAEHFMWQVDAVEMYFSSGFRLVVGCGAELSLRNISSDAPERHPVTYWPQSEVEEILSSEVLSPVFFKTGSMRVAFRNGWILLVADGAPDVDVSMYSDRGLLWTRSGLIEQPEYPVIMIDPWTGNQISGPPWPPKPDDLDINYDSDDINQ